LEPGRWLFVTGERDDLPGVRASELVMLAGVEQGVRLVSLTDENLPRVGEATALRLTGRGSTGPGGLDLTISARRAAGGSVSGYAHLVGGATGEVVGIVPPDDERDFWCINVRRTDTGPNSGDQRINWYVRDAGDGITAFDEISYVTSIGGDCENLSAPTGSWLRLVKGDFHVSAEEPTGEKVHSTIILAGDLAYPYKRETVRIYGNVVNATHGETRPEVLGSGDASEAFQKFSLNQSPLTHVAATTPSGVESTLEVYVNDIRWHEAEHLSGLQPTDRRFITQTDDLDEVTVVFGDGQRGARLPTGVENVRAVYRTGIGKAGNVAEGQISLLATRPLGLKGVINPQPATGGADRETREGARRNAPLGVKVLDRLVSVRDYEDFAHAFAGIGKASSTRLSDGRQQLVHLTIAGADDIPIAETSDLYRNLLQALRRFGDPQQPIRVEVRELLLLIVSAGVRLLPDYLWEPVEREIRAALLETFGFEQRDLGQDALLSEVISTIQHVPGVAYVDVDTFGGIPEKTVDVATGLRRVLLPSEIEAEITRLTQSEEQPYQRVRVDLAGSSGISIRPAQLAFLTPLVPDTLILKEITA
ncbi:MAG TPA: putative baseplate assembly protein, partial [Rubrobacter sp.]|nr:putative baseplate assembly protein [Rubrobacter sp.]